MQQDYPRFLRDYRGRGERGRRSGLSTFSGRRGDESERNVQAQQQRNWCKALPYRKEGKCFASKIKLITEYKPHPYIIINPNKCNELKFMS